MWLLAGPKGVLAWFHVRGDKLVKDDECTCPKLFLHTHEYETCWHTRCTNTSHDQWHKSSVVVFRLHQTLLMQCVLYSATSFHFHPHTAAPPFCSSHLHRSICTQNMWARCTFMQRECNVGHQTEPSGRQLLFVSSEEASRVKNWCERKGVKKKKTSQKRKIQWSKQKLLRQTVKM